MSYNTFGMSSSPRVTVTVRCVWAKNNMSIQSGCRPGTRENLQEKHSVTQQHVDSDTHRNAHFSESLGSKLYITTQNKQQICASMCLMKLSPAFRVSLWRSWKMAWKVTHTFWAEARCAFNKSQPLMRRLEMGDMYYTLCLVFLADTRCLGACVIAHLNL